MYCESDEKIREAVWLACFRLLALTLVLEVVAADSERGCKLGLVVILRLTVDSFITVVVLDGVRRLRDSSGVVLQEY